MTLAHRRPCLISAAVLALVVAGVPGLGRATPVDPAIMAKIGPRKANPGQNKKLLVEQGRELFMNETFKGNGRTCATCHPPTNNFTLDPAFIATLPDNDPLFVAEFNPALAELEDPVLMRNFALILENLDSFARPGVMRSVPHTLALPTSIGVAPGDPNLTRTEVGQDNKTVAHGMGWSGDGAPGTGSLREFAVGAVIQHFPKTLNRAPGKDFRLPTAAELDALEAFQLSLGRQTELNLALLNFADSDPESQAAVDAGKALFNSKNCAFCHSNAGANSNGFNRNFQTNVMMLETPARAFDEDLPGDGGFNSMPEFDALGVKFYGNRTINVPPLVEAADTGPFFHNNAVDTIEEAVAFYTTTTFSSTPIELTSQQINEIGAFLRMINALENIRSSNAYSEQAQREVQKLARQTVKLVVAETEDAVQVLTQGKPSQNLLPLYQEAVALLEEALDLEMQADETTQPPFRNALLRQAAALKNEARGIILE